MKYYISAIAISLAIIVTGFLVGRAYNYKFKSKNTVSVLGSSEYNFTADLIVWSATYTRSSTDLKDAYSSLKNDEKMVREYLAKHQIAEKEMIVSAIVIDKQYATSYDQNGRQTGSTFTGYQLKQTLKVESKSIEKVEKISREITELLQSGIELSSQEPLYYYTKLSDLKINLLAKASADAYSRATTIANNASSSLGRLRKATMGVFQITGQYSNEDYTYGGAFNTTNKNKTASITVRLEYELE
jgi:hypothetical protein